MTFLLLNVVNMLYMYEKVIKCEKPQKVRLEWSLQLAGVQLVTHKPTRVDVATWTFGQTEQDLELLIFKADTMLNTYKDTKLKTQLMQSLETVINLLVDQCIKAYTSLL